MTRLYRMIISIRWLCYARSKRYLYYDTKDVQASMSTFKTFKLWPLSIYKSDIHKLDGPLCTQRTTKSLTQQQQKHQQRQQQHQRRWRHVLYKSRFFRPTREKRKWRDIRFSKIGREIEILKRNKVMQELLWTLFWTAGFKREGFERVPREIRNVLVTGLLLLIAAFHASESDWVWIFNEQVVGLSLQNFFVSLDMELFSGMRLRLALAQVVTSCRYDQPPKHFTTCEMATFHTCLTIGTIHLLISFF